MKSRERVWAALNHQEPDKVPLDLGATQVTSLTLVANDNLKEYLQFGAGGEVIACPLTECVQPNEQNLAAIRDRLQDSAYESTL